MSDVTSIQYEAMQNVANQFDQEAARIQRILTQVNSHVNTLKGGGWIADAATQFYNEMDNDVCPAIQRLHDSLREASRVSREIITVLKAAEEEACGCLPTQ